MKKYLLHLLLLSLVLASACTEYSFENPKELDKRISVIDGGDNDWTQEYVYSTAGLLMEVRFVDKEAGYRRSVMYEYNSDNLPTKRYLQNDVGSITEEVFYAYEGGLLKSTAQFDTVASIEFETRYEVVSNDKGRIIEFTYTELKDQQTTSLIRTELAYDRKGHVTEAIVTDQILAPNLPITYTYEYDKEKNPLQYSYINDPFEVGSFYSPNNVLKVTANDESFEQTRTYQYSDKWPTQVSISEKLGNTTISDFEAYTY